jgi:hypothetical protein
MSKTEQFAQLVERAAPVQFRREMEEAASYIRKQDEAINVALEALDGLYMPGELDRINAAIAKLREVQG